MKLLGVLLTVLSLVGCNGSKQLSKEEAMTELAGIYNVTNLGGKDMQGESMTLKFDPETMAVGGASSCNKIFGSYSAEGNTISLSSMGMTKMYCEGKMEAEKDYMQALQAVNTYRFRGGNLELLKDKTLLIVLTTSN